MCGAYMFLLKNANGTVSPCGGCDHVRNGSCPHRFTVVGNNFNPNSQEFQTAVVNAQDALRRLRAECPGAKPK